MNNCRSSSFLNNAKVVLVLSDSIPAIGSNHYNNGLLNKTVGLAAAILHVSLRWRVRLMYMKFCGVIIQGSWRPSVRSECRSKWGLIFFSSRLSSPGGVAYHQTTTLKKTIIYRAEVLQWRLVFITHQCWHSNASQSTRETTGCTQFDFVFAVQFILTMKW